MAITLDSLPLEIVALIAEPLADERAALLNFAVTSRRYQAVAEALLWRRLFVRTGEQCKRILQSLKLRLDRATAVHEIELRAKYRHEVGLQKVHKILSLTHNLRDLTIESPTCNYGHWNGDANWPIIARDIDALFLRSTPEHAALANLQKPPLQLLKRLVVHSNGNKSRFRDLKYSFEGIFSHPCLVELTLSCANINFSYNRESHRQATPLKTLNLIECNIDLPGLRALLSCPRALEHLYLGENRDHQNAPRPDGCSDLLMEDEEQFFAALRQQAHSLRTMTYRPRIPELLDSFSGRQSFAEFTELTHFTINAQLGHSDLLESSLLGTAPRLESLTVTQEENRFHGQSAASNEQPAHNHRIIQLAKRALASDTLKELRLDVSSRRSIEEFSSPAVKSAVDASTKLLSSKQITLLIVFQVNRRWGLVPPYLFGEEEPSQRVIFDSRTGEWDNDDDGSDRGSVDQLAAALWDDEQSEDEEE